MLTDDLIIELKNKKVEIFENFKNLLEGIENLQDSTKVNSHFSFYN